MKFTDVVHVPLHSQHVIYFGKRPDANHVCSGAGEGLNVQLNSGQVLCAEKLDSLDVMSGVRLLGTHRFRGDSPVSKTHQLRHPR